MARMTVQELYDEIKGLHPSTIVILAKDAEGNGFSPLDGAEKGKYFAETPWSGDFYGEDDEPFGGSDDVVPAICLWPGN